MNTFCKFYYLYNSVIVSFIFFIGGGLCIYWSINLKTNSYIFLDTNATAIVNNIDLLKLSFRYIYNVSNIQYENTWVSLDLFDNSSNLLITYASSNPNCSEVLNIPGDQFINDCEPILNRPWTWQFLMIFGILSMTLGGLFSFIFMKNLRFIT